MSLVFLTACNNLNFTRNFSSSQQASPTFKEGKLKVALLVPLSGDKSEVGKNMLDATQLALMELKVKHVTLDPIDIGNPKDKGRVAIAKLATKNYNLIIGPIFSNQTKAVYNYAVQKQIPMISFSNDVGLLNHKSLFLIGFMPDQQIENVVSYSTKHGYSKIYALLPNNRYGALIEQTLKAKRIKIGYEIEEVAKYNPSIADSASLEHAVIIVKGKIVEHAAKHPNTHFAILIPEGGRVIKSVIPNFTQWAHENKIKFRFLGSGQWDDEAISGMDEVNGTWIASAPINEMKNFEARFYEHFSYKPYKISSVAYDTMALVAKLSEQKSSLSLNDQLLDPSGFKGTSGIFRFKKDGSNERALAIFEFENNKLVEVAPAIEKFK